MHTLIELTIITTLCMVWMFRANFVMFVAVLLLVVATAVSLEWLHHRLRSEDVLKDLRWGRAAFGLLCSLATGFTLASVLCALSLWAVTDATNLALCELKTYCLGDEGAAWQQRTFLATASAIRSHTHDTQPDGDAPERGAATLILQSETERDIAAMKYAEGTFKAMQECHPLWATLLSKSSEERFLEEVLHRKRSAHPEQRSVLLADPSANSLTKESVEAAAEVIRFILMSEVEEYVMLKQWRIIFPSLVTEAAVLGILVGTMKLTYLRSMENPQKTHY